ncbi:MAG: peptidylprolyl isomerase [Vallitalea sp.]|jgi:foldase protein PrsA|nr:peptidylprolyl isomerase [Vallitalea sp.]
MNKLKKIISIFMILTMVMAVAVGCGKKDDKDNNKDNATNQDNKTIVATINEDHKITLGEANLFLRLMEAQFEMIYGPNIWDQEVEGKKMVDIVKENAMMAVETSNIASLISKERGITITEEEITKNEKTATDIFEQLKKAINDEDEITLELVKTLMERQSMEQALLNDELKDYEIDQEKIAEMGNKVRVRHILFKTLDDNNQPISDDKKAKQKEKAQEILDKAKAGEDFATLAKEYTEDLGSKENGGEYTFGRQDSFIQEFKDAAFNLKQGEISDLVETQFGYHIIKLEEIIEPTPEEEEGIKETIKREEFTKRFEELKKDYKFEVKEEVWKDVEVRQSRNEVIEDTTADDKTKEDDKDTSEDDKASDNSAKDSSDDKKSDETKDSSSDDKQKDN